jgi:tetratricopeptide (TPR) repeat protein
MQTSERVCELSERLGDTSARLLGLANVGFVYHFRLELPRALEIARRCAQLVEQNLNGETPPYVQFLLAVCAMDSGDLPQARSLFTDVMDRVRSAHGQAATELRPWNIWVLSPDHLAAVQLELGRPDAAAKLSNEALRRGRELKDPFNLFPVTFRAGILRYYLREPQAARALVEAAIALTEGNSPPDQIALGHWFRDCWATAEPGKPETRIDELEENVTLFPDVMQIQISGMLAQVCIDARQSGRALKVLDEGLGKCENLGVHVVDTELHRLRGEAILIRDSSATAEAEQAYRKAIEIARGQSGKWWELRATTSLARLLAKQRKRDEARTMLADIYNWFTEGFDTADLKEAKALLEELGN